ncbi:MAG: hypothetical protein HKN70_03095 [Gammaproteobacteria bacterium]|nr:hypothetical protein [Gammaproteobacteria bacterium]
MRFSKKLAMAVFAVLAFGAQSAMAMTAPAVGDFAYDLYDIGVNSILLGAPGFVGAVLLMVYSGTLLMRNWILGVAGILAGTILINADSITTSMGMLI